MGLGAWAEQNEAPYQLSLASSWGFLNERFVQELMASGKNLGGRELSASGKAFCRRKALGPAGTRLRTSCPMFMATAQPRGVQRDCDLSYQAVQP